MKHARSLNANEILELMFIYLTKLSSLKDYDEIIITLADMGKALTTADRCTVWIVSEDKKTIWTKVAHGIDPIEIPIESGIVGSSITDDENIIIDDVYQDDRFNASIDKKTGYKTKSMLVMPMRNSEFEIIGAFQVINNTRNKGIFDDRDMQRLMLSSTYTAETLVSAKLAQEIESSQREVIFTMGAIGESRSKETGNHVKRVAEYSRILALAYGMGAEEAELLKQASPMHDIGKIAIPDSVLNKPGRFNAEERRVMDTHAELGYNMIKGSKRALLKAASHVAYEHHEKWNGKGYPRQLKGEEIHIYGRITAIADVFDALGSDRVYKKAWDDERIFKLFKEERAEHFDPVLVDLFFENKDKILKVRDSFKDLYIKKENKEELDSIKILGASGTKSKGFGTSAFYLNSKNVLDAGNLVEPLQEESAKIEHIWLTHSHLDHISDIAFVLDNYYSLRTKTLNIHALPQTIQVLKESFFNHDIWPDFSTINLLDGKTKALSYTKIKLKKEYKLSENESIEAFKTDHTVPSCGYIYTKNNNSILITADTHSLKNIVNLINARNNIKSIVVECSFPSYMKELAKNSKHLTPKLLFKGLKSLKRSDINLYINHIKPSYLLEIHEDIENRKGEWNPIILKDGDIIEIS
jgi:HD-GYP domain-containing protein (c-di-GMP phosphodiesterase class II)/ribonuclease BN (tRNA processing enzyme)